MLLIDEFNNWNGSLACAQSVNLLPNLEEIEWKYVPGTLAERTGLDIINWIAAFLPESTSLQKLHISSNYKLPKRERCYVDLEQICRLLQDAPQQWNCLDTLTFLPGGVPPQRRFTEPVDKYENLPLELSVGISSFIRSLGNLRTLSISTLAFEPRVITAIAQLPLLESLTIKCIYETGQLYYENWELPEPAFASLKDLQLHNICWSTVIRICDINPLVRNLRNVRVINHVWAEPLGNDRFAQLLSCLTRHNAPVSHLSVHSIPWLFVALPCPPSVVHLPRLPLTSLSLETFEFDNPSIKAILLAVPALEELSL